MDTTLGACLRTRTRLQSPPPIRGGLLLLPNTLTRVLEIKRRSDARVAPETGPRSLPTGEKWQHVRIFQERAGRTEKGEQERS